MELRARYYDGVRANPQDVLLKLGNFSLLVKNPEATERLEWRYENVRIIEKPEHDRPLIIGNNIEVDARIIVNDNSIYDLLLKKIPKKNAPLIAISTSSQSLAFWSIPAVAIIFAIYWFVPQIAISIAENFPRSWEENLGKYTVSALTSDKPVCNNAEGMQALEKMVDILAASASLNNEQLITQPITARVIQEKEENAFAAPGGKIVIFSKLIEKAGNADELAGVLAHEIGHVVKRHSTQTLVSALGLELLINVIFGGAGNSATTAAIANSLFQMQYSRNFEREADQVAMQILYNSGIDNRGLMNFFIRLQAEEDELDEKLFSYISSHPATSERIETIKKAKNITAGKQILAAEEWQKLKNICQSTASKL